MGDRLREHSDCAVARFRGLMIVSSLPGAYAPGIKLSPASQVLREGPFIHKRLESLNRNSRHKFANASFKLALLML